MKTLDKDNELRNLIKGIKLDSPRADFTSKVMNRVFEKKPAVEIVKKEKLLGRGFWVIISLFAMLFIAMFVFSSSGGGEQGQLTKILSSANDTALSKGFQSFFSNLGSLPLSIGGILFASSILVFIDRFLPQIMPHHNLQRNA